MGVLTLVYVLRREGKPEAMHLVSMMMSAGMVYLNFGKLLGYKASARSTLHPHACTSTQGLLDAKKDLTSRIERTLAKLTVEERAATNQYNGLKPI